MNPEEEKRAAALALLEQGYAQRSLAYLQVARSADDVQTLDTATFAWFVLLGGGPPGTDPEERRAHYSQLSFADMHGRILRMQEKRARGVVSASHVAEMRGPDVATRGRASDRHAAVVARFAEQHRITEQYLRTCNKREHELERKRRTEPLPPRGASLRERVIYWLVSLLGTLQAWLLTCVKEPYWRDGRGRVLALRQMSTSHLENAIRLLERGVLDHDAALLAHLLFERKRRREAFLDENAS